MPARISTRSLLITPPLLAAALLVLTLPTARAVVPFTRAKVTQVENRVSHGTIASGRAATRPAKVADVIKSDNFLQTEVEARAELQYDDGSLVRIGQNTVFSFEADTRTLALEKGSLIFHIPKGSDGGTIKTPSLTAAITGTVGKVTPTMIVVLDGQVTLIPSGKKVPAGYFARVNTDGLIEVRPFDVSKAGEGRLMNFHGPMPGWSPEKLRAAIAPAPTSPAPELWPFDSLDRTQNSPSRLQFFFPDVVNPRTRIPVPPPTRGGGQKPPAY